MKSILISIKPQWVAKILNGEKTAEIRKTKPKCELPVTCYIYCTKGDYIGRISKKYVGKVVAMFTLDKVEEITCRPICGEWESYTKTLGYSELSQASCLGNREIVRYLKGNNGYAWHISDLEIFGDPKELSEFYSTRLDKDVTKLFGNSIQLSNGKWVKRLDRAPQSWCYVEEREDAK